MIRAGLRPALAALTLIVSTATIAGPSTDAPEASEEPLQTIAFGSCLRQGRKQPVWDAIIDRDPDLFLFMGDNVYADTRDPSVMRKHYTRLASQPGFRRLSGTTPVLATWDDHDYGENDAGADFPMKAASEQIFLDFFRVPADAPSRGRPGIYDARIFGQAPQRVQVILLDTRYFRSPLKKSPPGGNCRRVNYTPLHDPDATMLGEEQWRWLAAELEKPAELRILVSSIQVIPDRHCFEKWSNLPLERERLFRTIRDSGASGIVLLSGDRHHGEISLLPPGTVEYPLYEVTASGMNTARKGREETSSFRTTTGTFRKDHFGLIEVDWDRPDPAIRLRIIDASGQPGIEQALTLGDLRSNGTASAP